MWGFLFGGFFVVLFFFFPRSTRYLLARSGKDDAMTRVGILTVLSGTLVLGDL